MEKNNETYIHDIEKLVSIIDSFYETEHFSDGWAICTFPDKPNMKRIRFLLELMVSDDIDVLSLSDIYDLRNIFTDNIIKYLRHILDIQDCFEDTFEFRVFLQKVMVKYTALKEQFKKLELLSDIQHHLKETLTNEDFDSKKFREVIGNKYKIISFVGDKKSPILVLDSNMWQVVCIDLVHNKVLHECWNYFEKWYSFGGKKIFIFDKKIKFDLDTLKKEIGVFDIKDDNLTVLDFLYTLKEKYHVQADFKILSTVSEFDSFTKHPISVIRANDKNIDVILLMLNSVGFEKTKKMIFTSNKIWSFRKIWVFDAYSAPTKIEGLYRGKEAINMTVFEGNNKKILVTNGDEFDMFDEN